MLSLRQLGKCLGKEAKVIYSTCGKRLNSTSSLVSVDVNSKTGFATVTMNRAPVNGLNLELLTDLSNTFDNLTADKSRGMILTSSLPTIFSGGLDIMEMYKPNPERLRHFWTALQDCWLKLFGSSFPTVAVINGHSPAGGCLLAMSCEYRVMVGGKFTIGLNETALGIVAPSWFQDTMRHTIAPRQAELALTLGTLFSTEEALKINLIDEIASDKTDAFARGENFLSKFSKISPQARMMSKIIFRKKLLQELEDTRDDDVELFVTSVNNPKVQKSLELYMAALKSKGK